MIGTYVTAEGFQIPSVTELLDALTSEQRSTIDPNLDTAPESPVGQLNGIFASHLRENWEAILIAANGYNPDAAESWLLDALCAITGTHRGAATFSSFRGPRRITLTLDATTTVNAGALFSVLGNPSIVFRLTDNVTSTAAGDYLANAQCTVTGPIPCAAGTLTVIQTPVVGLNAVTNSTDAILGVPEDTDAALRTRRQRELAGAQAGTPAAVTAGLLAYETEDLVHPILDAITYENTSDHIDAQGRPPHSIEALVYDGDVPSVSNDVIAQLIWDNRGGGIQTFGNASGTATDYRGQSQTVYFSRPTIVALTLIVAIYYDSGRPAPDEDQVKAAMVAAHNAASKLGQSRLRWITFAAAVQRDVPGALETPNVNISGGGALVDYIVAGRTKTTLDTADITVALMPQVP